MKIAVVNNAAPFQRGGAESLADALVHHLGRRGHDVELVRLPFNWSSPEAIIDSMIAARSIVIDGADRVIGLKFPAYLVPHHNKVLWLLHQFRQVYDMWETPFGFQPGEPGDTVRRIITEVDNDCFAACRHIQCIAPTGCDRLARFNGVASTVLHHPLTHDELLRNDSYDDYILALGRINASKRQLLAIEALAHTSSPVKLVVAGPPETPNDESVLRNTVHRLGLADRVVLRATFIDEREKADLLAKSLAVAYLPIDEDSYGYVTIEAMTSHKAVVTVTDSGGLLEVVKPGLTGFVCEPTAPALAAAFDQLFGDRRLAQRLGTGARTAVDELQLSWDRVVEVLTS